MNHNNKNPNDWGSYGEHETNEDMEDLFGEGYERNTETKQSRLVDFDLFMSGIHTEQVIDNEGEHLNECTFYQYDKEGQLMGQFYGKTYYICWACMHLFRIGGPKPSFLAPGNYVKCNRCTHKFCKSCACKVSSDGEQDEEWYCNECNKKRIFEQNISTVFVLTLISIFSLLFIVEVLR